LINLKRFLLDGCIPDKKLSTYSIISFNKTSRQVFIQNLL